MLNSFAAGRCLVLRLVLWQLGMAVVAGFTFLIQGWRAAFAALAGALAVALGNALAGARVFSPGGAMQALVRVFLGMLLKWAVVLVGVYVTLVRWQLPPVPVIAGLTLALMVNLVMLRQQ